LLVDFPEHKIQESLQKLYVETSTPKVRRRILKASARAPGIWRQECNGSGANIFPWAKSSSTSRLNESA
jgi:hypothetical protein